MSSTENNSEVAVEKVPAEEKKPASDTKETPVKGTKRPAEDKNTEVKKAKKEENGGATDDEEEEEVIEEEYGDEMVDSENEEYDLPYEDEDVDGEDEEEEEEDDENDCEDEGNQVL